VKKSVNPFPVTARDEVFPTDPKSEPTRDEVNAHPEGLLQFMERTRRYYRLTHKTRQLRYARGLDSHPEDMA
jgi:hypothetical protein